MIKFDEQLYNEAKANAGMDVHDVYKAAYIYARNVEFFNASVEKGAPNGYTAFLAEKYEKILRSFLVTKDIHKSKAIIEESLKTLD